MKVGLIIALSATVLSCGLFPDLSDLTGDASALDASSLDAGDAGVTDARVDVGDAAWQRIESEVIVSSDGGPVTTAAYSARAGDLVIIGCDMAASVTIADLTGISSLSPNEVGPARFPNSITGGGVQAIAWWGVIQSSFDGGAFGFKVTPQGASLFTDCSINVYRGGTTGAAPVDSKITSGVDAGLVSCGPVSTVAGGVAYYIAVRWGCAGVPLETFTQQQDPEGNPNGDLVPTDGATVQTQLADCNNSTGDWVCLTLAISP